MTSLHSGKPEVLYVGSWSRSGSTLLDLILGQIPGFISVGELRYLWERGLAERQLCGCGYPVPSCPFWAAVLEEALGNQVNTREVLSLLRRVDGLPRVPVLIAPWRRRGLNEDLRAFREVLSRLYRAVTVVSGASRVVDSSKYAAYGLIVAGMPDVRLLTIHLIRDSRAVAFSWLRGKSMPEVTTETRYMPVKSPWRSAVFWELENLALELLRLASPRSTRLRYEDLTRDPSGALGGALAALGIQADLGFLREGTLHVGPNHTVAGNPLRFRRGEITITPDLEWLRGLEPAPRRIVTSLTWPLLVRYGFPLYGSTTKLARS